MTLVTSAVQRAEGERDEREREDAGWRGRIWRGFGRWAGPVKPLKAWKRWFSSYFKWLVSLRMLRACWKNYFLCLCFLLKQVQDSRSEISMSAKGSMTARIKGFRMIGAKGFGIVKKINNIFYLSWKWAEDADLKLKEEELLEEKILKVSLDQ